MAWWQGLGLIPESSMFGLNSMKNPPRMWAWRMLHLMPRVGPLLPCTYFEYPVHMLEKGVFFCGRADSPPHEGVDGVDDVREHLPRDETVVIQVVQAKRPLQFVMQGATAQHGQRLDELLK
ncbi:hypothetical protein AVEN_3143-1 [Araneus ventricosus]|uniref:Uncharacterized protein n=1 Tax=Araneus ventricosus TaxID=182803 RepID=A0A4Y2P2I3_ARAVE|nr:hypothetical protein AVEN_3143-1 [Araneus ventricosus]